MAAGVRPGRKARAWATLGRLIGVGVGVGACSYDWSVGDGVATKGPGNVVDGGPVVVVDPGTPRDAGSDASRPPPLPTNGECGAACACRNADRCRFTCTRSPCTLTCSDRSDCALDCAPGAACNIACSDGSKCDMTCNPASTCGFACRDEATCTGACTAAVCTKDCRRKCDVKCTGGLCL